METFILVLQIIIAIGIYNVWLVRFNKKTAYRGKGAVNMKAEFKAYGLPKWFVYGIGFLKISIATLLVIGIWVPVLVQPAAIIMAILMLGAVSMHIKVSDSFKRILPSLVMLALAILVAVL